MMIILMMMMVTIIYRLAFIIILFFKNLKKFKEKFMKIVFIIVTDILFKFLQLHILTI